MLQMWHVHASGRTQWASKDFGFSDILRFIFVQEHMIAIIKRGSCTFETKVQTTKLTRTKHTTCSIHICYSSLIAPRLAPFCLPSDNQMARPSAGQTEWKCRTFQRSHIKRTNFVTFLCSEGMKIEIFAVLPILL